MRSPVHDIGEDWDISEREENESLRHLVALAEDGVRAYEDAVVAVRNRKLKKLFRDLAISRAFAAVHLRKLLRQRGSDTSDKGTLKGAALRLYGQFKVALAQRNDSAVLEQLQRSERRVSQRFREVAQSQDSGELRDAIGMYAEEIAQTLESLAALRKDLARPLSQPPDEKVQS